MKRLHTIALVLFTASLLLAAVALAQDTPKPLPPGMKGSDASDPRSKLTPGLYDAGETAVGLKHVALIKKPDTFQLGTDNTDDPKVKKMLGSMGINDPGQMPKPFQLMLAQLAFANSDLAFEGNHLFMGNFYGMSIYDISDPAAPKIVTSMVCPGGQGDPSVYKNLLFMSVEMPNGRVDCGEQGFAADPAPADCGHACHVAVKSKDHIFHPYQQR